MGGKNKKRQRNHNQGQQDPGKKLEPEKKIDSLVETEEEKEKKAEAEEQLKNRKN